MKRHEALILLSRFHRRALFIAQMAKEKGPKFKGYPTDARGKAKYALDFYEHDLKGHFELEEEVLFPSIKGFDTELDELAVEVSAEHSKLRELFERLVAANHQESRLDELGFALEAHIRKEERVLFQKIQEVLSEKELENLKAKLQNG